MIINQMDISNLKSLEDLIRFLQPFIIQTIQAVNHGLTFADNMASSMVNVTFPATANQNLVVTHNLPVTPTGYLVIRRSAAGTIYDGISPVIGKQFINLKSNVANMTATLIFF